MTRILPIQHTRGATIINKRQDSPAHETAPRNHCALILTATLLATALLAAGCGRRPSVTEHPLRTMAHDFRVTFPADLCEQEQQNALSVLQTLKDTLHKRLDPENDSSEISLINTAGSTIRLPISRDTYNLFQLAEDYMARTQGAFDITTSPVAYLWGFHGGQQPERPHSPALANAALAGVGPDKVRLHANAIELLSPLTRIHLEELAHAYAIDLGIIRLRRMNIPSARLDAPNTTRVLGPPPHPTAWHYPVANPFEPGTEPYGHIPLDHLPAAASIGLYDHHITIQGVPYSHIINPRTGFPADAATGVTVLAPTATKAYALAQALFVLGHGEEAARLKHAFPRAEFIIIPRDPPRRLFMTPHLFNTFEPAPGFDLTCIPIE